jgi:hypothetical protein
VNYPALRPCPGWVQIDHEQISSNRKKLRTSGGLVNDGAVIFKGYQPGGKNQENTLFSIMKQIKQITS